MNMNASSCFRTFLQISRSSNIVFVRTKVRVPNKVVSKSIKDKPVDIPADKKLSSYLTSLQTKGFVRSYKSYDPPTDVEAQVKRVCVEFIGNTELNNNFHRHELKDRKQRFKILTSCMKTFNHEISNSQLHKISTIGDLIEYFKIPVKDTTSYDDLYASDDLPPNLHVMLDPIRFHPDTDTMFDGISAYPGRSTIVSGLKAKKKYKGYTATTPFDNLKKL
ncbi:hypothetical protein CHUAL_004487 [Chamberlinius hualienensis]